MPRGLTGRIVLAFAALALATLVAVGGTLFVVLERAYADDAQNALKTLSVALASRPNALARGQVPLATLAGPRSDLTAADVSVYVARNGQLELIDGPDAGLVLPPFTLPGSVRTEKGVAPASSGRYDYGAVVFGPAARRTVGVDAVVVAAPDRAQAQALGSLVVALPAVLLALLVVGIPVAWLLSRSVTGPMRRLGAATAVLPAASGKAPPLPLEGPAEVQELTRHFNGMASALAATREAETQLLSNLRHDLRTPLTSIAGYAQAIEDGTVTGEGAGAAAGTILEEAQRLERLVAELGTIERLREGSAALRPETIDTAALLASAVARFRPQADAQSVTIEALPPPPGEAPLALTADRLAVERILQNLVGNALAAVPIGGHVWLQSARLRSLDRRPGILLSVSHDGPGFPPGSLGHVFERFFRADPARSGGGSGLGLAIVRELAQAHGGDAWAENLQPHGARVSVALPRVPGAPSPANPTVATSADMTA